MHAAHGKRPYHKAAAPAAREEYARRPIYRLRKLRRLFPANFTKRSLQFAEHCLQPEIHFLTILRHCFPLRSAWNGTSFSIAPAYLVVNCILLEFYWIYCFLFVFTVIDI